ncbi:hypothetical protein RB195_020987 [Necator americanus]
MADPELASKLAKRLENIDNSNGEEVLPFVKDPPPVPLIPEKVVPNPYVASDDTVSIDDLIAKTLKRNERVEENNNNVKSMTSSTDIADTHTPSSSAVAQPEVQLVKQTSMEVITNEHRPATPNSPSPKAPPPKTTIGELLVKDQKPVPPAGVSRCPVVPIQHHRPKAEVKQRQSPEEDGSELERKLAAQRAKKRYETTPQDSNVIFSNSNESNSPRTIGSTKPEMAEASVAVTNERIEQNNDEPVHPQSTSVEVHAEVHVDGDDRPSSGTSSTALIAQQKQNELSPPPSSPLPPGETPEKALEENTARDPVGKVSEGTVDADDLRNLVMEELKKNKVSIEEMIVLKGMEQGKSDRTFSPSRELLEMIQRENGIRSPPPIPPPKPQTPSHSRPQSPLVAKKFSFGQSSVGEQKMFAERQNKPSLITQKQALSVDSGDELSALLERRNKIIQGESVPEMIHKKLSLYAEFSEFSRKQIKFFTETFKKYDEDGDGFIDFDELKRMMEKLGEAQTHIALKEIIRKVDEDQDGKISLREFFLLFRFASQNQLGCSQVFQILADSVDVSKEGVLGAANFFQAKIEEQTKLSRFEQEMKEEQEERKRLEEEKKARREKFLQNKSIFQ